MKKHRSKLLWISTFTVVFVALWISFSIASSKQVISNAGGECIDPDKIDLVVACPAVYKPVCGCNCVTYSNECFAKAAGVKRYTEGPCVPGQNCPDL